MMMSESPVAMNAFDSMIKVHLFGLDPERRPDEDFRKLVASIQNQELPEAIDGMIQLLEQLNEKKNPHFIRMFFSGAAAFLEANVFFLVEVVNTSLDYFFHQGDIRMAFRILKLIGDHGDSRTLEILRKYSGVFRDGSVVSRLLGYRNRLERRLAGIAKKLETLELAGLLGHDMEWQGEINA